VFVSACIPRSGPLAFESGNHHEVVRLGYAEFDRLVRPVVGEFCRHAVAAGARREARGPAQRPRAAAPELVTPRG
jgi:hypothetical protein